MEGILINKCGIIEIRGWENKKSNKDIEKANE